MSSTMLYVLLGTEVVTVAAVIGLTIWIMQDHLSCAHHLLRLGVAIVCAGSALELSQTVLHFDAVTPGELAHQIITNIGQIVVYLWVATSKALPRLLAEAENEDCECHGQRIGNKSYLDGRNYRRGHGRMGSRRGSPTGKLSDTTR